MDKVYLFFSLKDSQKSYTIVSCMQLKIIAMNQQSTVVEYKREEMENDRV